MHHRIQGFCEEVICEFIVCWPGWELDDKAWIAIKDGKKVVIFTNHGTPYVGTEAELEGVVKSHRNYLDGVEDALARLKA